MDKIEWQYIDVWSKKIRAINILGGKCIKCNDENIFHLCFHHREKEEKEEKIQKMKTIRWSKILSEIKKCDLLCENCHQELHDQNIEGWTRTNKRIYLEYKRQECEICKYKKNQQSLSFHHKNPNEKSFSMRDIRIKYISELDDYIKAELDKCEVLCRNCHNEKHVDMEKFENLKDKIYLKVLNFKETQPKISRDDVYKMFDSGIKKSDIAEYFNSAKSTITNIIKKRDNF